MIAVSAWLDEGAEAAVRDVWRWMAEAGIDDSLHAGPYRPHVTLGIWEAVRTDATLASVACGLPVFTVTFRAIGIYPGHASDETRPAGVYLAPTITAELRRLHEIVHATLHEASGAIRRFAPGRWEPHCTVAWMLPTRLISAAVDVVLDAGVLPLGATITRIGLVDTPAEVELASFALKGSE